MKRAALFALCCCSCIDWNRARTDFFNDGGSGGGSGETGGGAGLGGGAAVGGGLANGGGGNGGGNVVADDGGIVCQHPVVNQVAIQGRIVALGFTTEGVVGVGSVQGHPLIVTLTPDGMVNRQPQAGLGRFETLAVSADGHRIAATGVAFLPDGGADLFTFERVDGGLAQLFSFVGSSAGYATITAVALSPVEPSVLFMTGTISDAGTTMSPFPPHAGMYLASVDLDDMDSLQAAGSIVGDTCSGSDVKVVDVGSGILRIMTLGRGSGGCAFQLDEGTDAGVTGQRFLGIWKFDGTKATDLVPLSTPALLDWPQPGFRDRLFAFADAGVLVTSVQNNGSNDLGALITSSPLAAEGFSYSGDRSVYLGALAEQSGTTVLGGLVTSDAGHFGAVWRLPMLTTPPGSAERQLCSRSVVTDVLLLPDGGIVSATVLADGGDFTLVQQL